MRTLYACSVASPFNRIRLAGGMAQTTVPLLALLSLLAGAPLQAADPHRLDTRIRPLIQMLDLQLDPAGETYEGAVRVQLEFSVETNRFRFHAEDMEFGKAVLDGRELKLTPESAGIVSATTSDLIPPGIHSFEIAFTNDFNHDGMGLSKVEAGGNPYLFTQMEPNAAHRSFPCWDEPGFKIPWQISLTIPAGMEAVGNMPIVRSTLVGDRKRIEFGRSPAMPSYLVALAVGKLTSIDIAQQSVPGRIYTVLGQDHLAQIAAEEIPPLLTALENYFGIPYPYPKLDHVAVPGFIFGAMENVGLITYRDVLFLFDRDSINFEERRLLIEVIAHEIGHMWFGNLVTMEWWDDLWLNESFASWISNKIAEQLYPDLRFDARTFRRLLVARRADAQKSVGPIRRTFDGDDNFTEAVDDLSYSKGEAILRMLDNWLGEENFRRALQDYFTRHLWGNVRAEDLWAALSKHGEGTIEECLRRYIEQPGIPELTFSILPNDRLEIRQHRYRTLLAKDVPNQTWYVPVVIRYGDGTSEHTARLFLTNETASFSIPGVSRAKWLYPNAGETGCYMWALPPDLAAALTERDLASLSIMERLGVLSAANFGVQSGAIEADQWLNLLRGFAHDPELEIQELVVSGMMSAYSIFTEGNEERAAFLNVFRGTLRSMLDRLGFEPKSGEGPQWDPLRASLVSALGIDGNDSDVVAFCRESAKRQIAHPRAVRGALAQATLLVATWHGDAQWADQMRRSFETASEPDVRERFLRCLIPFRDPSLARAGLDYLLTDAVRAADMHPVFFSAEYPQLAGVMFEWIQERYAALSQKLPREMVPFLPSVLTHGDEALLDRGRKFFLDPARTSRLMEVEFTKAAEAVQLRAALRKRHARSISNLAEKIAGGTER